MENMKPNKRDPKMDLQRGDVVQRMVAGRPIQRKVFRREGNEIQYATCGGIFSRVCYITTWQAWCRTAEVLEVTK